MRFKLFFVFSAVLALIFSACSFNANEESSIVIQLDGLGFAKFSVPFENEKDFRFTVNMDIFAENPQSGGEYSPPENRTVSNFYSLGELNSGVKIKIKDLKQGQFIYLSVDIYDELSNTHIYCTYNHNDIVELHQGANFIPLELVSPYNVYQCYVDSSAAFEGDGSKAYPYKNFHMALSGAVGGTVNTVIINLLSDVKIDSTCNIFDTDKNYIINLNGHTLKRDKTLFSTLFEVGENKKLCIARGVIDGTNLSAQSEFSDFINEGTLKFAGVELKNSKDQYPGYGIKSLDASSAYLELKRCKISNYYAEYAVVCVEDGLAVLDNTQITKCKTKNSILENSGGTLILTGGTIVKDNEKINISGEYTTDFDEISNGSIFILCGASIRSCISKDSESEISAFLDSYENGERKFSADGKKNYCIKFENKSKFLLLDDSARIEELIVDSEDSQIGLLTTEFTGKAATLKLSDYMIELIKRSYEYIPFAFGTLSVQPFDSLTLKSFSAHERNALESAFPLDSSQSEIIKYDYISGNNYWKIIKK